jgi:tetratricopeptide (TPR) repeat protein
VLIGGGGRGKTRLAVELAARARGEGWTAGFAPRDELDVFRASGCRTAWDAPTLVVVDYAAAKATALAAWLRALVHDAGATPGTRPKLRLLLLERAGGEGTAWWREVFGGADLTAEAVRDLLPPDAPLTVGPLADPAHRHAVFAAAFAEASGAPAPARNAALDDALARASLGGEPLFLAMFGLTAARQGLEAAKALPADRIALDLAGQELERIGKVWQAHGLPATKDRPLHAHLAAVAVLCEGLTEAESHAAIGRESAALRQAIAPGNEDPPRAALHAALPGEAGGIAAIQPDILGEAAMILAWRALPDGGVEAVRRAAGTARRDAVTRSVIRACQDFLVRGQPAPLAWLKALRADAADLEALLSLSDALPPVTLELRETALELAEAILGIARGLPEEAGEFVVAFRGIALNNLSLRLSDLGRREDALAAIEEAVGAYRALAAARPDAFAENLSVSLWVLADRLREAGRPAEAIAAHRAAIETLTPHFLRLPHAFTPRMVAIAQGYIERCDAAGRDAEEALLAPIVAALQAMQGDPGPPEEED